MEYRAAHFLDEAADLCAEGNKPKIKKKIAAALRELKKRRQVLPWWVQVGSCVQWMGAGKHVVYTVVEVVRRPVNWYFVGECMARDGSVERMYFSQEAGRRYWRRVLLKGRS
jgi:hypothetical protein